jgi:hypothetical protein
VLGAAALGGVSGCAGGASRDSPTPVPEPSADGGATVHADGFELSLDAPSRPKHVGVSRAAVGNFFLVVDVTLHNTSVTDPMRLDVAELSLTTARSLVVSASPLSAALSQPCRPEVSIGVGGAVTCAVAFELAIGTEPSMVVYADASGHRASVAIPPAPPSCPIVAAWTRGSDPTCGECIQHWCQDESLAEDSDATEAQWQCLYDCTGGRPFGPALCSCESTCFTTPKLMTDAATFHDCAVANCNDVCR